MGGLPIEGLGPAVTEPFDSMVFDPYIAVAVLMNEVKRIRGPFLDGFLAVRQPAPEGD